MSGGFVYGAGGTGFITPRMWMSPLPSMASSPMRNAQHSQEPGGDLGLDVPIDGHQSAVATQVGA